MGREGEAIRAILPEFGRLHPDIAVRVQTLPWSGAREKLLTAFVGDATPDLCQLGSSWVPEFVALNALERLDDRLLRSASVRAEDYFPGIWDTNIVAGKLYGVPWYGDTRLLFYRTDLLLQAGFRTPPESWEQWSTMLAALKAVVGPERYGVLLPLNEFDPLLVLALQQRDPLLRDEGRFGNFRGRGFRLALQFYRDMFSKGWAPTIADTQISNVWDEFSRGYFTFFVSGPWNIGELKRRFTDERKGKWMTAVMPGPDGPGFSLAGGSNLVIFRHSQHKDEAWKLIEFLSLPATQERIYELTGNLPTRRSAWLMPALAGDPYAEAFRRQLERVKPPPKVPEFERIVTEMRLVAERVVHGDLSIDEAVNALDHTVDGILAKRRSMMAPQDTQ
jgi:multiple sugar transport system substrate-binding protein